MLPARYDDDDDVLIHQDQRKAGEKATLELHKNAAYHFELIFETAPNKIAVYGHFQSHKLLKTNKTCRALPEKQG